MNAETIKEIEQLAETYSPRCPEYAPPLPTLETLLNEFGALEKSVSEGRIRGYILTTASGEKITIEAGNQRYNAGINLRCLCWKYLLQQAGYTLPIGA